MLPWCRLLEEGRWAEAFSLLLVTRGQHLTMLRELALSLGTRNLESDLRGGLRSRPFRVAAAELPVQWPWWEYPLLPTVA